MTFDSNASQYICKVSHIPGGWRDRIATMTGDVVHNLRSALDQLAWQLVLEGSGKPSKKEAKLIYFPIHKDCNKFVDNLVVQKMTIKHRDIVEQFQPFTAPVPDEHPLVVIQDLSNDDKHRLLTPILVNGAGYSLNNLSEELRDLPLHFDLRCASDELEVGSELARIGGIPAGLESHVEKASGVVPGLWLKRTNNILEDELSDLADFVQHVVDRF